VKTETPPEREVLGIPFAKNLHPMWIFDRETLHFLEVNDVAGRRYGFSREEFLTMTLRDIGPAVPKLLQPTQDPRLRSQSTGERWRHLSKRGATNTSWEMTFRGHPAELVLGKEDTLE
jgi:two-component system, cell cycle sensor histidine kinase and response regulator CckA